MHINSAILLGIFCIFIVNGQDLDRPEGSPCKWENLNGTCVDARKCTTFIVDMLDKNLPPICSFQGNYSIICCNACEIEKEIPPTPPPLPKLIAKCQYYYERLPYKCKPPNIKPTYSKFLNEDKSCYHASQSLVAPVGGEDAKRYEHPHMVLLGYGSSKESAQWGCAGSVISETFILTAGHCASSDQLGPVAFAALGILKRSDPASLWEIYRVKRFIPHPEYKPPARYNDIALIETDTPIKFSISVMPACVGEKHLQTNSLNIDYSKGYALGWGGLGPGKPNADTLQLVRLDKFSTAECSKLYPKHRLADRGFDAATQTCYGDRHVIRDTCKGDSGGPLVRKVNGVSCSSHVVGVTSYGLDCGFKGTAGVYTLVESYESWIERVVFP